MYPPILGYPDFNKSFELHTDTSSYGLRAVQYQEQGGHNRVIAYASRSLNKSEQHYPAYCLEFLALKWAITEKFSDYLKTNMFKVLTDNNPLNYVLTFARLDATTQRWIAVLSSYDFEIRYKPGIKNSDADGMSRLPALLKHTGNISPESVKAICIMVHEQPVIETISLSTGLMDSLDVAPPLDQLDVSFYQSQDSIVQYRISRVRSEKKPPQRMDFTCKIWKEAPQRISTADS